ncbi:MAG: DUF2188 domain-containing protein [Aestuariivita sp.]|nr:DUF2188 domain-containing protein [Aestuariivita sp.]
MGAASSYDPNVGDHIPREEKLIPKANQHVVPRRGRWAVRRTGANKARRLFDTQKEAIAAGRQIARKECSELYIHGEDGKIRERRSYGGNSFPPKG